MIKDLEKVNSRQMEILKRKQEREIKRLEQGHQDLKTELKKAHADEVVDLQHENLRVVASESEKKEKVLGQMKDHLETTRKMTDKQIEDLKNRSSKIKKDEYDRVSIERDRVKAENELYLEDLNHRFSKEHRKIVTDNQNQLRELTSAKAEELNHNQEHFTDKINNQTNQFTTKFTHDARNYQKMKDDQDKQFKNERLSTNLRQQVEMAKLTNNHNQTIEVKDKNFRKGLKDQDLMFEKKYAETLKVHTDNFKRLSERTDKAINKMKDDLQEKLMISVKRSDDPFYRFTELKPVMKQFADRVEIQVEIPEHSKQDVHLSLNNKEAVLTFNRRYDDSKKEAGVLNKVHKVESFTSRLQTKQHLDPKSVQSSYADGVMTYVIKHA